LTRCRPRPNASAAATRGSALGIPVLRTLSFAGGFVAQALLVLAIFKLI
jgi:hypothetical protein